MRILNVVDVFRRECLAIKLPYSDRPVSGVGLAAIADGVDSDGVGGFLEELR